MSGTVSYLLSAPVLVTVTANAAAAVSSGNSAIPWPSYSPKANQKPISFPPRDSAASRTTSLRSCGLAIIARMASGE